MFLSDRSEFNRERPTARMAMKKYLCQLNHHHIRVTTRSGYVIEFGNVGSFLVNLHLSFEPNQNDHNPLTPARKESEPLAPT